MGLGGGDVITRGPPSYLGGSRDVTEGVLFASLGRCRTSVTSKEVTSQRREEERDHACKVVRRKTSNTKAYGTGR